MTDKKQKDLNRETERCCGGCCWFYGEDTDGWGFCACQKNRDIDMENCSDMCEDNFVSIKEMRHHTAVLLQEKRWQEWFEGKREGEIFLPSVEDVVNAQDFAYKYMKVFSKL